MITLEQLQEAGGLAGGYKRAAYTTAISLTKLQQMSEEEQAAFTGTVVIDNCQWAATTHGMPIAKASSVYSCDGKRFGNWKKELRTFFELELIGNKLATMKQFKLPDVEKGGKPMASNINLDEKALNELMNGIGEGATQSMQSFDNGNNPIDQVKKENGEPSKAALKRLETERELNEIRSKLDSGTLVDRADAIINNVKNGRLICFITKTDPSVRLSVSKVPVTDEKGQFIPVPDADPEILAKVATGERKLPLKLAMTNSALVFKHVKPSGKPVGAVIKTPVGSEVSFTKLFSNDAILADTKNTDMRIRVLDADSLHPYIAANYKEKIKEDESILGARATWLILKPNHREVTDSKTQIKTKVISATLVPEKKEGRKALLVDGNFVPLKVYQTISQQDLTEQNKATLNLLIESALKSKGYDSLSDESKRMVHQNEDGSYTSAWFNEGTPIRVDKYDGSGPLTNVQLPVIEKVPKKDNTGFRYSYQYLDMDSEQGPLSMPQYQQIIALTGKSPQEFKEAVKSLGQRHRATASTKPMLTADEYLQAISSKSVTVAGASSFAQLQQRLEGLI